MSFSLLQLLKLWYNARLAGMSPARRERLLSFNLRTHTSKNLGRVPLFGWT